MMEPNKRTALEQDGWRIGTVADFLDLSPEEASFIELKLALGESLRAARCQRKLTQQELAALLKSSQSRVAKMEAGDPSVSLDLIVRSLFTLGVTRENLAHLIAAA